MFWIFCFIGPPANKAALDALAKPKRVKPRYDPVAAQETDKKLFRPNAHIAEDYELKSKPSELHNRLAVPKHVRETYTQYLARTGKQGSNNKTDHEGSR